MTGLSRGRLAAARLILADLTGRNPNVLYQLGLANGFGKDVLLLASEEADIPADLRYLTYFVLDKSDDAAAAELLIKNVEHMLARDAHYTLYRWQGGVTGTRLCSSARRGSRTG